MLHHEVIETIRDWEGRFPVERWTIGDVHVWPLVRVKLGSKMIAFGEQRPERAVPPPEPAAESGLLARLRERSTLRRAGRAAALFYGYPTGRELLDGTWYDRAFDPLADILEENGLTSLHLEYRRDGIAYRVPRRRPALLVRSAIAPLLARQRRQDRRLDAAVRLEGYSDFAEAVHTRFAGAADSKSLEAPPFRLLTDRVRAVEQVAAYFDRVFECSQPRAVFACAYYSVVGMALCLAALRRGITAVDLQHGVTIQNPAYEGWTRFPRGGYELLPRVFWCWTERDAQPVRAWPEAARERHRPLVGGQPWAALWERLGRSDSPNHERIDAIRGPALNVLVALSWSSALSETIREVLRASPADWTWWIRLHPTMEAEREPIRTWCAGNVRARTEVDEPSDLPLPLLLGRADVHVTHNSTVVQEAAACGLPSVVIDRNAEKIYAAEIGSGWARLAGDVPEILAALAEQAGRRRDLPQEAAYPSHDHVARALLDLIRR